MGINKVIRKGCIVRDRLIDGKEVKFLKQTVYTNKHAKNHT